MFAVFVADMWERSVAMSTVEEVESNWAVVVGGGGAKRWSERWDVQSGSGSSRS